MRHENDKAIEGEEGEVMSGPRSNKDLSFIGAAILVGAILISASVFYNTKLVLRRLDGGVPQAAQGTAVYGTDNGQPVAGQGQAPTRPSTPVNVELKPSVPYLGNKDAAVTVVEYADYQCPFCEKWYTTVMPELKSKYIDTGKIKFVYQDFAFLGSDSNTLSEGAHCAADQNKFWQYHDYIFSHQGQENSNWATPDKVKVLAGSAGLNSSQFNSCLDSGKYKQAVLDETAAGRNYGVAGTPSVFILKNGNTQVDSGLIYNLTQVQRQSVVTMPNGNVFIMGAQPLTTLTTALDAALKK